MSKESETAPASPVDRTEDLEPADGEGIDPIYGRGAVDGSESGKDESPPPGE